ncbi:MAG: autotransporter outer membrane beta-barrel domain-containing protein [Phascolarctobacterium sp.]|nr:autotransporter outer membrane beta-barrel domain-containing protein [Phascolarctobacterium sp.]
MKLMNKCKKAAILATVLGGICIGANADAATIVIGGATDYTSGTQIGALNGSWVTSRVDTQVVHDSVKSWFDKMEYVDYWNRWDDYGYHDEFADLCDLYYIWEHHPDYKDMTREEFFTSEVAGNLWDLRGDLMANPDKYTVGYLANDCDIHRVVLNGKTYAYIRQTTSLGTVAMDGIVIDLSKFSSLGSAQYKGVTDSVNSHGVAAKGKFIYCADYTGCRIGVGELSEAENRITNRSDLTLDLQKDLAENAGIDFSDDKYYIHGESLLLDGDYLYVLTNVNKGGEWTNYQPSYLIKYYIQPNGKLTYVNYTTMGKNTDTARINKFNDHIFVTAIGGYQNYGNPNASTSLDFANIKEDGLFGASGPIKIPQNVQDAQTEFRNLKILPDGTAYVLCYSIGEGGYKTGLNIFKTTISNLLAEKPQNWEAVANNGETAGWFNNINAEYYTKRVWVRAGNNLHLYVDGKLVHTWAAKEFATSDMFTTMQAFDVMTPEGISGTLAKLNLAIGEKAADNANAVWNDNATVESITGDKTLNGDTSITADNSKVDLGNNILAAVYAKDNNIAITANNLQLQSKNNIATPVGVYAGNGKEVNIKANNLNIITKGYEGGDSLTNAIWLDPGATGVQAKITIEAPVNISMTGGIGGNGIAIQKTDRWGESSTEAAQKAEVIIKGDVSVKGADNKTWGINANTENVFSRFNNAGILTAVNNSSVTVDGNVYLDVYGNGIATTAQGSSVTVNGGEITVPTGMNYGYYTLASYLGTINMNTGADDATPGSETVKLDGDIFALNTGNINLALTTEESYLNGVIDSAGHTNLWLQNGAIWTNEANNSRYYLDNEDVGSLANSSIKASHVNNFVGSSSIYNVGAIYQGLNSSNIKIDNYSGNAVVLYEHDGANNITGGTVTIGNAAENSTITLRTNYDDSMEDKSVAEKVLDDMANKLYYTAYTKGQDNLTGKVEIAEGLLTSAIVRKYNTGDIIFNANNGQGGLDNFETVPEAVKEYNANATVDNLDATFGTDVYGTDSSDNHKLDFSEVIGTTEQGDKKEADVVKLEPADNNSEGAVHKVFSNAKSDGTPQNIVVNMGGKELEIKGTATGEGARVEGISAVDRGKITIENAGHITIEANATGTDGTASAIIAGKDSEVEIKLKDNKVAILKANSTPVEGVGVLHTETGGKVTIDGRVEITETNGAEAVHVGKNAEVNLGGGTIGGDKDTVAIRVVEGGKICLGGNGYKVNTKGHIVFDDEPISNFRLLRTAGARNTSTADSVVTYDVEGSSHEGDFKNNTTKTKNVVAEFNNGADWNGNAHGVNMDVLLSGEGTVWTGYYDDEGVANTALALEIKDGALWQVEDKPVVARSGNTIKVKTMQGTGGFVAMGNDAMNIENYSGATTFIYENTDGNITGGNLTVEKVDAEKATLNLRTNDIGTNDKDKVAEMLGNLASKLYYAEADQTTQSGVATASNEEVKLSGQLQIAEGLLTTDKLISFGNLQFGNDGKALVDEASISFNESGNTGGGSVSYEENTMVRSAKSAMASSVMMWRNESDDVMQRMGDLRLGTEDSGIWAKYYNGNASYNENNTNYSSDYKAYQVGYDKKLENGWIVGAALSYNDAEHKYAMGAKGEGEAVSVSAYGAWNNDKGHFANVIVKGSKLDNEYNSFDMYKDHELKGDYSTWGVSVSAEYGRRIEQSNGFYFEPSAKLTIGRVQDTQYTASTDFTSAITGGNQDMYIEQVGFNSIVGELGVGMGKRLDRGTVYTKLAVAHEFAGDFNTTYMDENSNMVKSNVDFGGSWFEWQIGGSVQVNDNSYVYATYEKTFGGDAARDWRVDAGVRWTF